MTGIQIQNIQIIDSTEVLCQYFVSSVCQGTNPEVVQILADDVPSDFSPSLFLQGKVNYLMPCCYLFCLFILFTYHLHVFFTFHLNAFILKFVSISFYFLPVSSQSTDESKDIHHEAHSKARGARQQSNPAGSLMESG